MVHTIQQGEGGEQGDAFMPLLFCMGQHAALQEVQARLRPNERLSACLDDVYVVSKPDRVGDPGGKTHVWNLAGQKPDVCEAMQRIAEVSNLRAQVWRGCNTSGGDARKHDVLLQSPHSA